MPSFEKTRHIYAELKGHAPFTCVGALFGIVFMLLFRNLGDRGSHVLFAIFHPAHVMLSAMVTASIFKMHASGKNFFLVLLVGYTGSVGLATVSDVIIPHAGSRLLGLDVPTHTEMHTPAPAATNTLEAAGTEHGQGFSLHLGFIEEWYIVNPAAVLGILAALFFRHTKLPHAGHVLISTWASSSYLLMTVQSAMTLETALGIFVVLVLATWLPCWISDIIFPLLFVPSDVTIKGQCSVHDRHSHPHTPA